MADRDGLQRAITRWVEWYRGINDPGLQRKVAEKQIAVQAAQESMADMTFVDGWRSNRQVIIRPPDNDDTAWMRLTWALRVAFNKVPTTTERDTDKVTKSLKEFTRDMGETRAGIAVERRRRRRKE